MANSLPPPSWAPPTIKDKITGKEVFNPVWLQWFMQLSTIIQTHNALNGLQGGSANEYYHFTSSDYKNRVVRNLGAFSTARPPYTNNTGYDVDIQDTQNSGTFIRSGSPFNLSIPVNTVLRLSPGDEYTSLSSSINIIPR